jgi:putative addiction module component (TIGR02574 family)
MTATETVQGLLPSLLALSARERLQLAKGLIDSIPVTEVEDEFLEDLDCDLTQEQWQAAWDAEIRRRDELFENGKTQLVVAEDMFQRIRERLDEARQSRSGG